MRHPGFDSKSAGKSQDLSTLSSLVDGEFGKTKIVADL
jgi:hypothetical protein